MVLCMLVSLVSATSNSPSFAANSKSESQKLENADLESLSEEPIIESLHKSLKKAALALYFDKPQKAIDNFNQVIKDEPTRAEAFAGRAYAYACLGKMQPAIDDCSKVLELKPAGRLAFISHYLRGSFKAESGDLPAAIEDISSAININPKSARCYEYRGTLKVLTGQAGLGVKDYDKAIELNPESWGVYLKRGHACMRTGSYKSAVRDFTTLVDAGATSPDIFKARAEAYKKLGDEASYTKDMARAQTTKEGKKATLLEEPKAPKGLSGIRKLKKIHSARLKEQKPDLKKSNAR